MPSPFLGMDPFLEHPAVFPDLHDSFIAYLREALQGQLPAPYYAELGQRVWVELSERFIAPDVNVLRAPPHPAHPEPAGGGVAVATRAAVRVVSVRVPHDEVREPFVAIYTGRGGDRRLVTAIELLSPSNKTPGARGRDLYLRKQQELVYGQAHLVEIDLLRAGEHATAVPRDRLLAKAQPFDYHVCVHRFDEFEEFLIYPIQLEESLPVVAIPLLGEDPPIEIDLQAVFTRSYDTGPYRRSLDYSEAELDPPVPVERGEWLRGVIGARC